MNSLMMISNVFLLLTRALTSVGRIAGVLDEEPFIANPAETSRLRRQRTAVSSFATFPLNTARMQPRMCSSISTFASRSGSTVGILGGTGSGKSSIVAADCASVRRPPRASYLWADTTCATTTWSPCATPWALCCKRTCCSRGTVRENLQWGNPQASDDELLAACRAACVDEFLDRIGGWTASWAKRRRCLGWSEATSVHRAHAAQASARAHF